MQRFAQQNNCETTDVTLQFSSNLSRNGIARQVAEKIAQCNRALTTVCFWSIYINACMFCLLSVIEYLIGLK